MVCFFLVNFLFLSLRQGILLVYPGHETQWLNDDFGNEVVSLYFTSETSSTRRSGLWTNNISAKEYLLHCLMKHKCAFSES